MRRHTLWSKWLKTIATVLTLTTTTVVGTAHSQTMDYNLNQAKRTVDSVTSGLQRLQPNDINGFNRLSVKLNKAAELLQTSESKSHPEFATTVQQWTVLQQQMAQIAAALQAAQKTQAEQAKQQQAEQQQAEQQARQTEQAKQQQQAQEAAEKKQTALAQQQARDEARKKQAAQAQLHAETLENVLNPMLIKYERQSLPKLPENPTQEQATIWAEAMHKLQTTLRAEDLMTVDSLLESGSASQEDAQRVKYWIDNGSQDAITELIRNARSREDGAIVSLQHSAELINAADPTDKNQAYRFAGDDNYANNQVRLDNAIRAATVVDVFNSIFGQSDNDRTDLLRQIKAARFKLDELKPAADEQAKKWANSEPAQPEVTKDFLAPIAQEFWLEGDVVAESDTTGAIWMDGRQVADITHNGEIWIGSYEMGSIEPNGEVWFDARRVGTLEPNGEVWRNGNQVGLIEQNGTAWINGSASGEIAPFQGEWKRAAVIYYFPDFFQ